ncbi:type IV secretion system protein [Acidiferrobacter sp.]|uniref:type IV secretion system protein n=1 Tax=Acidiferrobacter sp. TaxID=1872107 RepID=UPI0026266A08|nr:type IV secretion system protein [Acidiferrobacter sp.]
MNNQTVAKRHTGFRCLLLGLWVLAMLSAAVPAYAGGVNPNPTPQPGATQPAQPSPASQMLEANASIYSVRDTLTTVVSHLNAQALQMAGRYTQTAKGLVVIMMTIMVSLLGLKIAFDVTGGLSGTFRAAGELLMMWGLVMWALTDYAQITGWIVDGFTSAANIVTNSISTTNGFAPDYEGLDQMAQLMLDIRHLPWNTGATLELIHWGSIIDSMVATLFDLLMAGVLLFTSMITIIFFFISQAYISVAIAVGPVFLPWAIIPWTRKYAANWVHFLIQGGMYRLIAPVMMSLATQVTAATNKGTSNIVYVTKSGAVQTNFIAGIYMIAFGLLMAYFMLRIPAVVQSLSSGFLGSSLGSVPNPRSVAGNISSGSG